MASGINLKKAQLAYNNVNKDIKNLETQLANFRKAVAEMNASIWYGGNSANKWYESANAAYKKDCKFLDSLYNIQSKLANKIDSTLAASGSTEKTKKTGKGSGTGGGSSVSGAASAAAAAETPADNNSRNPGGGNPGGGDPGGNGDPDTQSKFSNESKKKAGISGQDYAKYGNLDTIAGGTPIVPANYGKSKQVPETYTTDQQELKKQLASEEESIKKNRAEAKSITQREKEISNELNQLEEKKQKGQVFSYHIDYANPKKELEKEKAELSDRKTELKKEIASSMGRKDNLQSRIK